jgi:hypothetical protein
MNNSVKIRLLTSDKSYRNLDLKDESQVEDVIRNHVLPLTNAEYYRVDVKIKRKSDQAPKYLVAYLLRKDIYLAEVVKVDIESNFQTGDITWNYNESDEEEEDELVSEDKYACAFNFVVATPVPDIPSAKEAVEWVYAQASKAGLQCKMLLGEEATVANYKMYLTCGLKGFVNIGHGNPQGIALADGSLTATWLNSLADQAVKPAVVYFNSCQVHNDPLKAAEMKAGARTFIGGITNLLIGPSEAVCKCFWDKVLSTTIPMGDALHQCEKDKYPSEEAHGIIGDVNPFKTPDLKLSHAMWVHGHSIQVEFPERLSEQKRMGFYAQLRGKPFTSNWLHFAVPTPVIVDGSGRLCVGSVMIRFRAGPSTTVTAVHIYDGETKIASHDGLSLSPQNDFVWSRFDVVSHPYIKWGLGISIGVRFGDGANLPANKLLLDISSVGCDFMVPVS